MDSDIYSDDDDDDDNSSASGGDEGSGCPNCRIVLRRFR
jgi:hypothetical protein